MAPAKHWDVVVLGAGAAGLMCAFEAGRRGRRVLLLDHGERPGRKILISGGGRCNFTNTGTQAENFLSENPHFARSALARFTPADMVALVQAHGLRFHEKKLGQLFCDDSARGIVQLLERECGQAGVDLRCGVRLLEVQPTTAATPRFQLRTGIGEITCETLVVATGGLSIPKMGATGFGFDLARQFGHRVVPPRPALVPLTFAPAEQAAWLDLAGVSTAVAASAATPLPRRPGKTRVPEPCFRENLLFTHRGLSGPAILQISSYWQPGSELRIDLAPGREVFAGMRAHSAGRGAQALLSALKQALPARLAERWAELWMQDSGVPVDQQRTSRNQTHQDWTNEGLERAEAALHAWRCVPAGTEGYPKAEVTAGGVDTRELDARTLESLKVPGLHFIGEVVDVTGWLGGYNFQWAWASAAACGRSL